MADKLVDDYKVVNIYRNSEALVRVIYDFAKDGGAATDTYHLFKADEALVLTDFWLRGITELDSAGDGVTIDLGIDGGTEDSLLNGVAEATVAAGALIQPVVVEGTPNVVPLPLIIAADEIMQLKVIGEALTSGKCEFCFVVRPAE